MPGVTNEARFTIEGTASEDGSGNRKYDAINGQTLDVTLEVNPSSVSSATYSVVDSTVPDAPLASKDAPAITWVENAQKAITPSGVNDTVTIILPASGSHSYLIRCQVVTPSGAEIFERLVTIRTPGTYTMRKTIPAEAGQYGTRSDSDEQNEIIDAIISAAGDVGDLLLTNFVDGTMTQGQAVYIGGASKVLLAADTSRATATSIGLVNQASIPKNEQGRIAFSGPITVPSGIQTGTWTFGQRIYVDASLGKLTNTPSTTAGRYIAEVGICLDTPGGGDATVLLQKRSIIGPLPISNTLTLVAKKSAGYTAGVDERVPYDPAAAQTLKPPASPNLGAQWAIKNVTTDMTSVTIDGNGENIEDPVAGGAPTSSFGLGVANIGVLWQFMNSDSGDAWHVAN